MICANNCALALACISRGLNILHSTLSCIFLFHIFVTFLRRGQRRGAAAPHVNPPLVTRTPLSRSKSTCKGAETYYGSLPHSLLLLLCQLGEMLSA